MKFPAVSNTVKVKQIILGTDVTLPATSVFNIAFKDNTINILGVLGYTLGDRSFGAYLGVTGIFATDSHTVNIYGYNSKNTTVLIPSSTFVFVLYE